MLASVTSLVPDASSFHLTAEGSAAYAAAISEAQEACRTGLHRRLPRLDHVRPELPLAARGAAGLRDSCDMIGRDAAEESGASPERSRHCDRVTPGSQDVCCAVHPQHAGEDTRRRVHRHMPAPRRRTRTFPFSAVVGSDDLALALVLTTVSPEVGGVLVRGEKGTAKTTMVRALAAVLPPVAVVEGCRFSCDPADPDPAAPTGRTTRTPVADEPAAPGWSSCRSAPPRTG